MPHALIFDFLSRPFLQLEIVIDVFATTFYISADLFVTLLGMCQHGSKNIAT